jgi:hypothetical protein
MRNNPMLDRVIGGLAWLVVFGIIYALWRTFEGW